MTFNPEELGQKLAHIRKNLNYNQDEFSEIMGVSKATLSLYERGRGQPTADFLYLLHDKFQVDIQYLLSGEADKERKEQENFLLIPRYDILVSAGDGRHINDENLIGYLSFQAHWLQHLGLNQDNASVVTVKGDSMEPTIRDGSILLIRMDEEEIKDGSIYVLHYGDQTFVKRLKRDLNGIHVISDNELYEPQFISFKNLEFDPLHIAGRVIWYGSYA